MRIRTKLLMAFMSIAGLVALVALIAFQQEVDNAELGAMTEAQRVAETVSEAITFDPDGPVEAIHSDRTALQQYVSSIHKDQNRDVAVLDLSLDTLADA